MIIFQGTYACRRLSFRVPYNNPETIFEWACGIVSIMAGAGVQENRLSRRLISS